MKVILTHNNADCDAIASLLAMHKLDPEAIPILPPRVNSNVSRFLLLYARDWPFQQAEDLTRREISLAYVVDTQAFNQVRGMSPHKTAIHIIDHHPKTADLPAHYHYQGEATGANVTLLLEMMQARGLSVTALEATLLLLGLYEDTGGLRYKSTTPRDALGAAWLLERGADLDVVGEFLRHSPSPDQAALLQSLQNAAIIFTLNGHPILVAANQREEQLRESALLARELLTLYDAAAVLVVLGVGDSVQCIARANVDAIDLGGLMRHFGGNGHTRAAAALVRGETLENTLARLLDLLPRYVQPALRVADLMSWGVQTLQSGTTVKEAQAKMLESGHEGYPVVDESGHIVGLLTRRAVDRAMLHHLHKLRVDEVMESGTHSVKPSDSVETLKDKMLALGWGQMPVADEEGRLLGIVTRTDLIRAWGKHSRDDTPHQALEQLRQSLPAGVLNLLIGLSDLAQAQDKGLYLVGGIVRDLLLGRPNLDLDLVVEGEAIPLAQAAQARYGGELYTHPHFKTAKWSAPPQAWGGAETEAALVIDFATSRAEFYAAPTVLPIVRQGSIKLDLHRRDFSINALALRLAPPPLGQVLDFYQGERDLREGVLRVLHSLSFIDDPTRILRAVRFEQRFGFHIEARTLALLESALPLLDKLSGERLRHEFALILGENTPLSALQRLEALGVFRTLHPDWSLSATAQNALRLYETWRESPLWPVDSEALGFVLLLSALPTEAALGMAERLNLPKNTQKYLRQTLETYPTLGQDSTVSPSAIVAKWEKLGEVTWAALYLLTEDEKVQQALLHLATQWRHVRPSLTGDALRQMGLPADQRLGALLKALRAGRLDGTLTSDDDERNYVHTYLQNFVARGEN